MHEDDIRWLHILIHQYVEEKKLSKDLPISRLLQDIWDDDTMEIGGN